MNPALSLNITAEATSNLVSSGEWLAVHGYVTEDGLPMRLAEVWLLINGKYVKCIPQTCWHERFWFNCRFGIGRYRLQVEAYKVMEETTTQTKKGPVRVKRERKLKSEPMTVVSVPRLINANRMLPRTYEAENWRKVTLDESIAIARKAKKLISARYPDTSKVYLVGGVRNRGWSRRDIDLLVVSPSLYEEYKVKGERTVYQPPNSGKVYQIKCRLKDWRDLSFEKEVERYVGYPMTVLVIKQDREGQSSWGMEI